MHPEVVKYCSAELMQDNYFHAVFEAAKGLAQRIRDMTGIQADGANLIDRVFSMLFPSQAAADGFFADPAYRAVRAELFDPAVESVSALGAYDEDR